MLGVSLFESRLQIDLIAQHWHIMFCGNNTAPKYALPSASFASKGLHVEVVGSNSSTESRRGGEAGTSSVPPVPPRAQTLSIPSTVIVRRWKPLLPVLRSWPYLIVFVSRSRTSVLFVGNQSWKQGD